MLIQNILVVTEGFCSETTSKCPRQSRDEAQAENDNICIKDKVPFYLPKYASINRPDNKPLNGPFCGMTPATPIIRHLARPREADIKEEKKVKVFVIEEITGFRKASDSLDKTININVVGTASKKASNRDTLCSKCIFN